MYSDPLDPGEEVRGCSVGYKLAKSDISTCSLHVHREFPELKKRILSGCVLGAAIFRVFCFLFLRTVVMRGHPGHILGYHKWIWIC